MLRLVRGEKHAKTAKRLKAAATLGVPSSYEELRNTLIRQNSEQMRRLMSKISLKQRLTERITDEIAKKSKELDSVTRVQRIVDEAKPHMRFKLADSRNMVE